MKLYHGSKSGIVGAIRPISREVCDFGRGFYMGTEATQPLTLICNRENPKFYTCEFNLSDLRVYSFEPTVEWAMFIAWNRKLIPEPFKEYYDAKFMSILRDNDVIVGKIANDRMVMVLDWYFKQFISDVGMLESLKALNLGEQYCAITDTACNRVKIVEERTLSRTECDNLVIKSENQRRTALKTVDRIRMFHRKDGEGFYERMARETGVKIDAT